MPFSPFHEKFADIAGKETRAITVLNMPGLPPGEYGLVELYCDEPGCDCRRVFLAVIDSRRGQIQAVIAYGWESAAFYAKWMHDSNPAVIRELQGPVLNLASRQSSLAPGLLSLVKEVLKDEKYVTRIKRHYQMYRRLIDKQPRTDPKSGSR
jgi:hypothetical protein